jgi:hypothetical protein
VTPGRRWDAWYRSRTATVWWLVGFGFAVGSGSVVLLVVAVGDHYRGRCTDGCNAAGRQPGDVFASWRPDTPWAEWVSWYTAAGSMVEFDVRD